MWTKKETLGKKLGFLTYEIRSTMAISSKYISGIKATQTQRRPSLSILLQILPKEEDKTNQNALYTSEMIKMFKLY